MKKTWIRKIPFVIAIAALGIVVFSGAVMLLWNSILPAVLHVGTITLLQAMGILLLSKILFGGLKGRHRMAGGWCRKKLTARWQNMTPEEQEKFQERRGCYSRYETV